MPEYMMGLENMICAVPGRGAAAVVIAPFLGMYGRLEGEGRKRSSSAATLRPGKLLGIRGGSGKTVGPPDRADMRAVDRRRGLM
jgi:hypothetical protein